MITVVGSLNMDFVFKTSAIPKSGETVLGSSFHKTPGGRGGNQAAAAARLGSKVTMIGAVGKDDHGEELIRSLKKDGVKTDYILKKQDVSTGIASVVVERSGYSAITVFSGANDALAVEDVERYHFVIEQSNVLLVQLETPLLTVKKALTIARRSGCLTILNPAPATKLDTEILANSDILTPNELELELLSGHPVKTAEDIHAAGNTLLKRGVKLVIVTLGDKGCVCITKEGTAYYPGRRIIAADTTSAGDCFNGALAVAFSEDKSIDEAVPFAIAASALSVKKIGSQISMPYRKEVDALVNKK